MKKKFKKTKIQKRINIRISDITKSILREKQLNYKVSLSTIAETAILICTNGIIQQFESESKEKLKEFCSVYYKSDIVDMKRSSIKPKQLLIQISENQNEQIMYTNALYHYAHKFKTLINDDRIRCSMLDKIHNELKQKLEAYWDYNNQFRMALRAKRQIDKEKL